MSGLQTRARAPANANLRGPAAQQEGQHHCSGLTALAPTGTYFDRFGGVNRTGAQEITRVSFTSVKNQTSKWVGLSTLPSRQISWK